MPHLLYTILFAILISGAAGLPGKRFSHAAYVFFSCMATVIAGSWIMFVVHG
jgi:hypothetical protein